MKKKILLPLTIIIILGITSYAQIFHTNNGVSESIGFVNNGKIINSYKLPYKGNNFRYFSFIDYYILGRCYTHSSVHNIILESYEIMAKEYPNYTFRVMECSRRKGGRPFPHKTHQNGLSVDFMTPLLKENKNVKWADNIGMWRYIMKFDSKGRSRINKNIVIDFDKVALHILTLEKVARKNGFKIRKVILETNLKDDILKSKYGKELKNSGIYFVKALPKFIDGLHDDHYHIDFVKL